MNTVMITIFIIVVLINLTIFNAAMIFNLSKKYPARINIPKDSSNPLFKMTLPDMEAYLNSILVYELIFLIEGNINKQDPNMREELYARILVSMNDYFADSLAEFSARLGPNYLNNFVTHSFHMLRINGELDKLISKNSLR